MSRCSELSEKDVEDLHYFGYNIYSKIGQGSFSKVYMASFNPARAPSAASLTPRMRRTSSVWSAATFLTVKKQPMDNLACKVTEKSYRMPKDYPHRFLQTELNIMTKLQHPYLPALHSILRKGPKFMVFMTLADRGNLCEYIMQYGPVKDAVVQRWLRQLTLALIYLHTMSIAHRDISCDNVLLTESYNVKLSDFGYSCFHHGPKYLHTHCGSMPYVAPEIIRGSPYNPKYSDIWSLGIVLFVMLNGTFPFTAHCCELQYTDQMARSFSFKKQMLPFISNQAIKMVNDMLEPNPLLRLSLQEIVESPWISSVTAKAPIHILECERVAQERAETIKEGLELAHGKNKKCHIAYPWIKVEKESYCQRLSNLMKRHKMKRKYRMSFGEELHFHFKTSRYPTMSNLSVADMTPMRSRESYRTPSSGRVTAASSHSTLATVAPKKSHTSSQGKDVAQVQGGSSPPTSPPSPPQRSPSPESKSSKPSQTPKRSTSPESKSSKPSKTPSDASK